MKPRKLFLCAAAALVCLAGPNTFAQGRAQRPPTPNDTLRSPEVLADSRVAFRIYAPKATEVITGGDWILRRSARRFEGRQ